jgi:hypothetical protein
VLRLLETESRMVMSRAGGGGLGELALNGTVSNWEDGKF